MPRILIAAAALVVSACGRGPEPSEGEADMPARDLDTVIEENAPGLLAIDGVEGLYGSVTGDGEPCIRVTVVRDTPDLRDALPRTLGGYPVVVVETGPIRPMGEEEN